MLMRVKDERSKNFGRIGFLFDVDVAGDFWLRFDTGEEDCFDPKVLSKVS
jgi:hypothetical protein